MFYSPLMKDIVFVTFILILTLWIFLINRKCNALNKENKNQKGVKEKLLILREDIDYLMRELMSERLHLEFKTTRNGSFLTEKIFEEIQEVSMVKMIEVLKDNPNAIEVLNLVGETNFLEITLNSIKQNIQEEIRKNDNKANNGG